MKGECTSVGRVHAGVMADLARKLGGLGVFSEECGGLFRGTYVLAEVC